MTLRVAQFFLKIAHLSFSMGPRGSRAYGLRPRLWLLVTTQFTEEQQPGAGVDARYTMGLFFFWGVEELVRECRHFTFSSSEEITTSCAVVNKKMKICLIMLAVLFRQKVCQKSDSTIGKSKRGYTAECPGLTSR